MGRLSGPMSRRALRRLRGEQRGQEPLGPDALKFVLLDDDDAEEEGPKPGLGGRRPGGAGKEGVRVNNRFELINTEDLEDDLVVNGERSDCTLPDSVSSGNKGRAKHGNAETKQDGGATKAGSSEQSNASGKLRKKKKKQKNKKSCTGESSENGLEDIDRLFQEWEAHRNLSQLPNFAFSVPLAYFLLSQQTDLPEHELSSARQQASLLIQQALTMFPGVLMPLLEYCSVRPDATVSNHRFFGPDAEIRQLVSLYLGRSHFLWKEPAIMSWLEENVHEVLQAVDAGDPAVEACENRRKVLYQRAPRNIHRHVILSEIKEAVAALPSDVTTQSVMGFDPLPPLDTIYSYVRPERLSPVSHGNTIALFFRSLLPNYTTEGERLEEGVAGGPNRNQGLNRLMLAVRDMMANFHFNDLEVPREDNPEGEGDWD